LEVSFRLFGKEFSIPGNFFSKLLGFHSQCIIDVNSAIQDFNRNKFWRDISKEVVCYRPHTDEIHHPTLRLMHKWLGFSLFPRSDFRTVRNDELKLLYAMIKRKKVSPIKFMMTQWLEILGLMGVVGCTSLVTRIAKNLGLLENASVIYINVPRWLIDYDYFNHAHMLKKGKGGKLVMMCVDYTTEFPLPDQNLGLYVVDSFVFDCRERRKHLTGVPL